MKKINKSKQECGATLGHRVTQVQIHSANKIYHTMANRPNKRDKDVAQLTESTHSWSDNLGGRWQARGSACFGQINPPGRQKHTVGQHYREGLELHGSTWKRNEFSRGTRRRKTHLTKSTNIFFINMFLFTCWWLAMSCPVLCLGARTSTRHWGPQATPPWIRQQRREFTKRRESERHWH